MADELKAPFPWFGGKSRVAHLVWERFGDVRHYIEPFFGSGAVLLRRPHEPRTETINDKDMFVANFWRAVNWAPDEVAEWADWPINEADLHARHVWLVGRKAEFGLRMDNEPEYFDAKIAGWWAWGISCWIGSGWCAGGRRETRPELNADKGVHKANAADEWPTVWNQPPMLSNGGRGVHRETVHRKRPILTGWGDKGVCAKRPHLVGGFTNDKGLHAHKAPLVDWMLALQARLRRVRVCCGDWGRVCTDAVVFNERPTGVFLDPPYGLKADRDAKLYNTDSLTVADDVRAWAVAHGDDKRLRIALCGYAGEHEMPGDWECVTWKAPGGYGNQGKGANVNAGRERIWFSPGCLRVGAGPLFAAAMGCAMWSRSVGAR